MIGYIYYYYHNDVLLYIGSTLNIKQRTQGHINKNNYDIECSKLYKYCSENNIIFTDLKFTSEEEEYTTIDELRKNEGLKQKELKPICNSRIAGRDDAEYYIDNQEHLKEKAINYHYENRDEILIKQKEKYEANKEARIQQAKDYQKANSEIVHCKCGTSVKKYNLVKHMNTKKHLAYIQK